jgi:hypothetical protein
MRNDSSIYLPRWFVYTLIIMITIPVLTGCSAGAVISKSASFAVSKYCSVPQAGRKAVRKVVSRAVHPNAIAITCSTDN